MPYLSKGTGKDHLPPGCFLPEAQEKGAEVGQYRDASAGLPDKLKVVDFVSWPKFTMKLLNFTKLLHKDPARCSLYLCFVATLHSYTPGALLLGRKGSVKGLSMKGETALHSVVCL